MEDRERIKEDRDEWDGKGNGETDKVSQKEGRGPRREREERISDKNSINQHPQRL